MNWNDDTQSFTDLVKNGVWPWQDVESMTMNESITLFGLRQYLQVENSSRQSLGSTFCDRSSPGCEDSEKERYTCHLNVAIGLCPREKRWSLLLTILWFLPRPHTKHGRQRGGPSYYYDLSRKNLRGPDPHPMKKGPSVGGKSDGRPSSVPGPISFLRGLLLYKAAPPPPCSLQNLEPLECQVHESRAQSISFTSGASTTLRASIEKCSNIFVEWINELLKPLRRQFLVGSFLLDLATAHKPFHQYSSSQESEVHSEPLLHIFNIPCWQSVPRPQVKW